MKMPRKLVITSLSLLVGVALAGSISSTVAWYQYATRALVAYTGATSHCTKLLRISVDNGAHWGNDITSAAFDSIEFAPVTTGALEKNVALPTRTEGSNEVARFYANPNLRQGEYSNWSVAGPANFAQFKVLIKVNDVVNTDDELPQLENDVYLTDLTIQDARSNGTLDLSDAIRVHVATSAGKNFLFAKNVTSTNVSGYLDLDNDGSYDTSGYEWDTEPIIYGGGTVANPLIQQSYLTNDDTIIASEDQYGELSGGTSLGKTSSSNGQYLQVTVTVWLEGWAMLQHAAIGNAQTGYAAAVWDNSSYLNKSFNVGLTFGVKLHADNE